MTIAVDVGTTNSSIVHRSERGSTLVEVGGAAEPYSRVLRSVVFQAGGSAEPVVGIEAYAAAARAGASDLLVGFKPELNKERLREVVLMPRSVVTQEYDPVGQGAAVTTEWVAEHRYGKVTREQVVSGTHALMDRLLERLLADPDVGLTAESLREEDVYIGVPVGYGPTARRRLLDAFVRTGIYGPADAARSYRAALEKVSFVYEPIALIAGSDILDPETVLVFDYGGGTLDLGIWHYDPEAEIFRELAFGGHPAAGNKIDRLLFEHLRGAHPEYADAADSGSYVYDTMRRISAAKEALSTEDAYELQEGSAAPITVTRDDLEAATREELERVAASVEACVARAGLGRHEIDRVIMSGGSSLLPPARDLMWRLFPTVATDAFEWPDPTSIQGSREALTGVAQGLGEFGWLERLSSTSSFEQRLPGDLVVWDDAEGRMEQLAARGTPLADQMPLKKQVRVASGTTSIAVYENIASERLVACLPDVRVDADGVVELEVEPRRFRLAPGVRVLVSGEERAVFDVHELPDRELLRLLSSDQEWPAGTDGPACGFLARRLRVGDYVRVPGTQLGKGIVTRIRRIRDDAHLDEMDTWKLGSGGCQATVSWEDGGRALAFLVESHRTVHLR